MAITPLTTTAYDIVFSNDDIVWPSVLEERPGGMTVKLGTAEGYEFPLDYIPAGMIILQNETTNEFSLLDLDVTNPDAPVYSALPSGWKYEGLVRASSLPERPLVSSVYSGTANDAAMVIPIADAIKTAIVTALPKMTFKKN